MSNCFKSQSSEQVSRKKVGDRIRDIKLEGIEQEKLVVTEGGIRIGNKNIE